LGKLKTLKYARGTLAAESPVEGWGTQMPQEFGRPGIGQAQRNRRTGKEAFFPVAARKETSGIFPEAIRLDRSTWQTPQPLQEAWRQSGSRALQAFSLSS
jgi:hypothetical protein